MLLAIRADDANICLEMSDKYRPHVALRLRRPALSLLANTGTFREEIRHKCHSVASATMFYPPSRKIAESVSCRRAFAAPRASRCSIGRQARHAG